MGSSQWICDLQLFNVKTNGIGLWKSFEQRYQNYLCRLIDSELKVSH
jgi:hypothetical protein